MTRATHSERTEVARTTGAASNRDGTKECPSFSSTSYNRATIRATVVYFGFTSTFTCA